MFLKSLFLLEDLDSFLALTVFSVPACLVAQTRRGKFGCLFFLFPPSFHPPKDTIIHLRPPPTQRQPPQARCPALLKHHSPLELFFLFDVLFFFFPPFRFFLACSFSDLFFKPRSRCPSGLFSFSTGQNKPLHAIFVRSAFFCSLYGKENPLCFG